jgi:predicted hotdog family 3-hydroxylacyl-ACP dehydratase
MVSIDDNILALIPQRQPMVMVDALLYSDDAITRSKFTVKDNNIFVVNGFLKEPGLVENIAQTAAARAGFIAQQQNEPVSVGYIGAVKNLEIFSFPKTGELLTTEITIENQIFEVTILSGKIFCNESIVAQCEMKIFLTK